MKLCSRPKSSAVTLKTVFNLDFVGQARDFMLLDPRKGHISGKEELCSRIEHPTHGWVDV